MSENEQGQVSDAVTERLPRLIAWDEVSLDDHWDAVAELVADHGDEALGAGRAWASSTDTAVQAVGLDVLGLLALEEEAARDALIAAGARLVASSDENVRWSLAIALGRDSTDPRRIDLLVRLVSDADPDVRFQAVVALSVPGDDDAEEVVVTTLMAAMADSDADVRDWATFALGVQRDVDTPELRDRLVKLLDDEGADTAGEAGVALAKRHDARVLPVLHRALTDSSVGNLWVEAAFYFADPSLVPALEELQAAGWQDKDPRPDLLDQALEACRW